MPKKTNSRATKSVAKKNTKTVATPVVEPQECHCGASCGCGCHHGKFRKIFVLIIVFLVGFAVAKFTCCCGMHRMHKMRPVFDNGCLVMESVKCPKMQQALAAADADMNGCITREEFDSVKREMHHRMPKPHDVMDAE